MFFRKANSDKLILTPLIPKSNVDLGVYEDALDLVFSNKEVRNIALSGSYGSGKSSIIKTYEKQKNKKFLYISLAHFVPFDDDKNNDPALNKSDTPKISVLEWKILNQLIHQINPNSIPQTSFMIKRSLTKFGELGLVKITTFILIFVLSLIHTVLFKRWVNFYNTLTAIFLKCIFYFTTYPGFRLFTLTISVVLAWFGLFKLLVLQRDQRIIKKLDVKGAVIEMFSGNDESYFDKYLNEILYLFSNTEQDVIVFEDMDRFNSNVIFERLREVNTLINHSRQSKNNPIRFIYLIRDDIFTKIDQVKKEHLQSEAEVDLVYEKRLRELSSYYSQQEIYEIKKIILSRKDAIRNKANDVNANLLAQITKLESQILECNCRRIKDLLPRETIDDIFKSNKYISPTGILDNFDNVKSNFYFPLLKFLIRNGYIDETYKDYMTYFYPNSLSARDTAFCRSITDQNAKSSDYIIDNPAMVLNRVPPEYFKQIEVLNYSLLDFLLVEMNPSQQLTLIFKQIMDNKLYNFIHDYFTNGKEIEKFILSINPIWPSLFSELQSHEVLDYKVLYNFVSYTFYGSTDEIIQIVNTDNCLTNFISNSTIFLWDNNRQKDFVITRLKMLNVLFTAIDKDKANLELLRGVYENSLYKIIFNNISIMLHKFYNIKNNPDFVHRNYSLILSNQNSPLAVYINNNIEEYLIEIIKKCDAKIIDDEAVALLVLNNENINVDLKKEYISLLKTRINELANIKDKILWNHILYYNDAILYSEKNVIDYFFNTGDILDDILINWINKQTSKLDFSKETLFNNENNERVIFLNAIVQCNQLNNNKYSEFIVTIKRVYVDFSFYNIEESKMFILIDNNVIKMNTGNLKFIRSNYSFEILCHYIIFNIDEYIKILETQKDLLNFDELEYIISSEKNVSEDNQIKLLKLVNDPLSIIGKNYSEKIKLHILSQNFLEDDYETLVKSYDDFSAEIKKAIVNLFINRAEKTIDLKYQISKNLFDDLINNEKFDEEDKKFILTLALPSIGESDCAKYLTKYGLKQFVDIFDKNKNPQFDDTALNRFILDFFIFWDKISEYNVGENGRIYIKH